VSVIAPNGAALKRTLSDSVGVFRLLDVPSGQAILELDASRLGDTLQVFGIALKNSITLAQGDSVVLTVGFTYPRVDLTAVDTVPLGKRVFTEGLALNPVVANGPRELHLRSGAEALRLTSIVRKQVAAGDSVRVLGRRAVEAGAPILTEVEIFPLKSSVEDPQPLAITTGRAATADGGTLGAQLVRVRNADLVTSVNSANDVVLTVDDGTGQLQILIRAFLGSDASFFKPDSARVRDATGLLVPYLAAPGQTRWRLALRSGPDLVMEPEKKTTAPPK
jgi:hypothetical protein